MPPQQQQQQQGAPQQSMPAPSQAAPATNESLSAAALAAAPPEKQKNMIGERLYPLIYEGQPALAGKITGELSSLALSAGVRTGVGIVMDTAVSQVLFVGTCVHPRLLAAGEVFVVGERNKNKVLWLLKERKQRCQQRRGTGAGCVRCVCSPHFLSGCVHSAPTIRLSLSCWSYAAVSVCFSGFVRR